MDEWGWGGVGGGFVHPSEFTSMFMMLKIVVCIGSDGVLRISSVFRVDCLGWGRWASDVDVCADGCVWADKV